MSYFPLPRVYVNPDTDNCPVCKGRGNTGDTVCPECDGLCRVRVLRSRWAFLVTSGEEVLMSGFRLDHVTRELVDGWEALPGDAVIWRDEEGQRLRIVAVVKAGAMGEAAVLYI